MKYGSVCSGIEAASVAWAPLGWSAAFVSEIDKFPCAVLAHRFPDVPLHGDFTTIEENEYEPIDLLVGGTPCQSFSIAGIRGGLDDDRGNLALEYLRLAQRLRPKWLVWENVPGVLSSGGGRDFGSILGGMVECGYGFAYRVLDAQYVRVDGFARAVPQRRRRVFVVGYLGDWRCAAAVLFERESLSGHPAPSRKARERIADSLTVGANQCSGFPGDFVEDVVGTLGARTGLSKGAQDAQSGHLIPSDIFVEDVAASFGASPSNAQSPNEDATLVPSWPDMAVTHALCAAGSDASEDGTGRGTPLVPDTASTLVSSGDANTGFRDEHGLVPTAFQSADEGADAAEEFSPTLRCASPMAVAYDLRGREGGAELEGPHDTAGIRAASGGSSRSYVAAPAVRRLTPTECERLQGFPDNWTRIPYRNKDANSCPNGPRYKALGNSMAVNVMRWIGQRIDAVEKLK
jgi:DNA (cytosine-5)-methyltransferase 1